MKGGPISILVLEDSESDVELMLRELRKARLDFRVEWAPDGESFLRVLDRMAPDLVLLDFSVPGFHGLKALETLRARAPGTPAVIVSGTIGEDFAIDMLKAGAVDYVLKQRLSRLGSVACRALREAEQERERKRAENALRDSEERLQFTLNACHIGAWEAHLADLSFIRSPEHDRIYGYPAPLPSWTYETFLQHVLPEDRPGVDRGFRLAVEARGDWSAEFRIRRPDNQVRWLWMTGSRRQEADGPGRRLAGIVQDVTDRKRMEEELRRSRDELGLRVEERTAEIQKQAELIELSHDAIFVWDTEGRITFWNKGAREVYGWTREEVLGKNPHALLHTEFPVSLPEIMAELGEKGHWEGELSHLRKDGRKIAVLSRQALRRDGSGRAVAVFEINIDITRRKQMEEQLQLARRMEALGTLAGGIAHDFNNLLVPVLLNTEMALMDIRAGALPSADSMETAIAGAKRGKELVQQIITFSRHKGEELKPVDLAPIIRETVRFIRPVIPSAVRLQTFLQDRECVVSANPTQIGQVLMNLAKNALFSMQETGGILEILLEEQEKGPADGMAPGRYACLRVKDTGSGMSPEVREKAFDPFFTTKAPGKGTGMGLAVVHGIVRKHGGEVRLESEPGKGTTVSVFLPLSQRAREEAAPAPPRETPAEGERVLFVDDDETQARTVESMLKRLGYGVAAETDPRKALELFRSRPESFDLLITDELMPYLPGSRLAREFLAIRPELPIILCTGFSDHMDEERAAGLGIRDFILKPFTMNEISRAIRRVLHPRENKAA